MAEAMFMSEGETENKGFDIDAMRDEWETLTGR